MSELATALRVFLDARPSEVDVALVGGIAVSTRTEPRFTRDLDFAVAVADDDAAEAYVWRLRQAGYQLGATIEQVAQGRLSTVRLRFEGRGPVLDLLFAASGIEPEVVAAAEPIEIGESVVAPVARVGHLIAMKLVSIDDARRPRDRDDLTKLAAVASPEEWARAAASVDLIEARGFTRGRDLRAALATWRGNAAESPTHSGDRHR